MAWFKVDDSFHDHHKVFDAPDCVVALWTRAGSWSSRNRKGGFVPAGMPTRLCDDPETAVRELLRRGLWSRTSGGYRFHDWADYQPTEEEAKAAQAKQSSGGALGNHRRWHVGAGKIQPDCHYCQQEQPSGTRSPTESVPDRVGKSGTNPPVPSRPDPIKEGGSSKRSTHVAREPGPEPPRQCPQHLDDPDPPPCGRCADTRKAWQAWERERLAADQEARSAAAKAHAEAVRAEVDACRLCDHTGYRNGRLCHHDPTQANRASRGAAAVRAQLRRPA